MPTAFLTRLVNDYDIEFDSGTGEAHVDTGLRHHKLVLYENTRKGLTRPDTLDKSQSFADGPAVQTLYHEGTHAYIDLEDYDDTREFGEAMRHYERARLTKKGDYVQPDVDTERAAQEAAACYVGHRAFSVWMTWWRVKMLHQVVKSVLDGKGTAAWAIERVKASGNGTVPNDYWSAMQQQVFGYVEHDGDQVEIADKPIYWKLSDYCDRTILESKISDHIDHMPKLGGYFDLVCQLAQPKYPELVEAMKGGPRYDAMRDESEKARHRSYR